MHELIGSAVLDTAGAHLGTVTGVLANPASDLLELDGGALVPLRFVVDRAAGPRRGRGARRASRPARHVRRAGAHRRLHHLPRARRALLRGLAAGPGPHRGASRRARPRPARRGRGRPAIGGRRALRRRGRHGPRPRPALRRGGEGGPAPPAVPARPGGTSPRPGRGGGARRATVRPGSGSRCCAGATRVSTSASPTISSTASCRWATTCSAGARWRPWWSSRPWPASSPGSWATRPRPATRASPRDCSSTPSTPGRRCSGTGPCPRSC